MGFSKRFSIATIVYGAPTLLPLRLVLRLPSLPFATLQITEFHFAATVKRLQHDRVARLSASNVQTVSGWMVPFTEELNADDDNSTLYNKIRTECAKWIGNKDVIIPEVQRLRTITYDTCDRYSFPNETYHCKSSHFDCARGTQLRAEISYSVV